MNHSSQKQRPDGSTLRTVPTRLEARTRPLRDDERRDIDLLAIAGDTGHLFVREGAGIAGQGEAVRIELADGIRDRQHVADLLQQITQTGDEGAIAFGAFGFRADAPASFVVPSVIVRIQPDGPATLTTVGTADDPVHARELNVHVETRRSPSNFTLRTPVDHASYLDAVATAVQRIDAGVLDKVVLARPIDVEADSPIVVQHVLARLAMLFPACMVFNVDGFLGASPELLVARKAAQLRSHPLAGTVARSGDPDADTRLEAGLLASTKDRWEHALVVTAIDDALRPLCCAIDVPDVPGIVHLRNVSHLGTRIEGTLAEPDVHGILDLVALLHPTPAVGGTPRDTARDLIAELEPFDREAYAGAVGWVDPYGDGTFAVGLRSATVRDCRARMWAGAGIVAGSDPVEELAETQLKFQAILAAIVRP